MRVVVVYESGSGGTRAVAEAIGRGAQGTGLPAYVDLEVVDSHDAQHAAALADPPDLLIIGTPTRARAADVREWLREVDLTGVRVATFTTRLEMSWVLTGRAAFALARLVRKARGVLVAGSQEFLVDRTGRPVEYELDHAYEWGRVLCASTPSRAASRKAVGTRVLLAWPPER